MRRGQRLLRTLGVAAASFGLAMAGYTASGSTPESSPNPVAGTGRPGTTVTLLTGDRVTVRSTADGTGLALRPGRGREDVRFVEQRYGGHAYVIPWDAVELVARGKLDRRLFDVTSLAKQDYGDDERADVPLLLSYGRAGDRTALTTAGVRTTRSLPAIDGAAAKVRKSVASEGWPALKSELGNGNLEQVWLDGTRRTLLDESVPQIGAPDAWDAGYTGKGSTVAVLDTGVDAEHPDLQGRIAAVENFTNDAPGDKYGHGTHVASTIAGTAAASNGTYKGVAPDADLLDGKVCDRDGLCTESAILAGMQWAAQTERADVVNLSLGLEDTQDIDPLEQAVNTLTKRTGTLFVVAAGNSGPDPETVGSPASADAALAVGAVTKQDRIASFSSRGPRMGDGAVKPEITAPGVNIVAAKANGTQIGAPVGKDYVRASGTSMATPHVAGAAALLAQQHPRWRAGELKGALMASAEPNPNLGVYDQGAGRVDLTTAITQTVVSEPASVPFGRPKWPHQDDRPVTEQITYRNGGSDKVTLDLTVGATGPNGQPAPDGMFTLSSDQVTVPAGGTASVDVTADTSIQSPNGTYGGYVSASAGSDLVSRTPIGVHKEVESYDLTLKGVGSNGAPATDAYGMILRLDNNVATDLYDSDGTVEIRLPKGDYVLHHYVREAGNFHSMVRPTVSLDRDITITADARKSKPVRTTVPNQDVRPMLVDLGYERESKYGFSASLLADNFEGLFSQQLGPAGPTDGISGHVGSQWATAWANSPVTYALLDTMPGEFPTGYQRAVESGELATLSAHRNAQVADRQAELVQFGYGSGIDLPVSAALDYDLPSRSTHHVDAGDIRWGIALSEFVEGSDGFPEYLTELYTPTRKYQAGKAYEQHWNVAVYGPSAKHAYANRTGDSISVDIPMYSDAAGHGGTSVTDNAKTVLLRDGKRVAKSGEVGIIDADVRPGEAVFELRGTADRADVSDLSTKTEASWTFTSDTASRQGETLPLWAVRFHPNVDEHNVSHDGRMAEVPVTVESVPGAETGDLTDLMVEVSTDDGATWTDAELEPDGANSYIATVRTPADATYVSLRATATDERDNKAELTIVRAYALG